MGVHFSALALDHGSALQCSWIMGVHFSSALGSLECISVYLDHGSALQFTCTYHRLNMKVVQETGAVKVLEDETY